MNKLLALAAVVLTGLGVLTSCGKEEASTTGGGTPGGGTAGGGEKKQRVFVMVPKGIHVYYEGCKEGFDAAGARYGVKTDFQAPQDFKLDQQINVIESLISRKVDGIAISANEDEGLTTVIKQAQAAGIKVVTFDAAAGAAGCYIGTMNEEAGYQAGIQLIKVMNDEGELAILQGNLAAPNLNERFAGLQRALKEKNSKIQIVAREDVQSKKNIAQDKTESLLQAKPNLKAIFGLSAECAPGAAPAVAEQKKAGKVIVAGFDDDPDTLAAIKAGNASFCLAQKTYKMGWLCVEKLNEAMDGKTLEKQIDTGVILITKDNVDSYKEQIRAEFADKK
jgi:ribose transport system substrate-binding protein